MPNRRGAGRHPRQRQPAGDPAPLRQRLSDAGERHQSAPHPLSGRPLRRDPGALGSHDGHHGFGRRHRAGRHRDRKALHAGPRRWRARFGVLAGTAELAELVSGTRIAWRRWAARRRVEALRETEISASAARSMSSPTSRRGERFTPANVRAIRPGFGLPPKHTAQVMGAYAAVDLARGTPLALDHIAAAPADKKPAILTV